MEENNPVQWVYAARDNVELAWRYDQWAGDYDANLEQDFGWQGPKRAAEVFARHVPRVARVSWTREQGPASWAMPCGS